MQHDDFEQVDWNLIEQLVETLAEKISSIDRKFDSICTISRGGLVPSRLLADYLGLKKIFVDVKNIPINSIFVDDIYDSGKTFQKISLTVDDSQQLVFATLYARRGQKFPSQLIFAQQTRGSEYIVFPWDKLEHKRLKKLGL